MTPEQLAELRVEMAKMFDIDVFTCDTCAQRFTCRSSFDPYNTDGDCLEEK
jgi:hypothetical protein